MITKDKSFPHPILSPFRDDVSPNDCAFIASVQPDPDNYYFDCCFTYANKTLQDFIKRGKAVHSVHVECRRNFYREIFTSAEQKFQFSIKAALLVGRVELSGFINAQVMIDDYKIAGSHPDYASNAFQIRAGDILAAWPTQTVDAFVDYDPLKQISSILDVKRSNEIDEGPMKLDTQDDRLVATLSRNDYDRYTSLKGDPTFGPLLANQVVVPVLQEAIHEIANTDDVEFEEAKDLRWFRSIHKRLIDHGLDVREKKDATFEALQILLRLPLRRSLEGMNQIKPLEE